MTETNQVQNTLLRWAAACSHSIGEAFDQTIEALNGVSRLSGDQQLILRQLLISCHLSSESVLILVSNVKVWDTETVLRSVVEGTFKFVYLCLGTDSEIEERFSEYNEHLPEINRIKRHKRVSEFLTAVEDPESKEWKPFRDLLLSESELRTLETNYPRAKRKSMEHGWSFHSIANSFDRSSLKELRLLRHLFYQYGMGSHISHQDADGVKMVSERNNRSNERREAIELVHGAREISDTSVMAFLRYLSTLHLSGKDTKPAIDYFQKEHELHNEKSGAYAYWHDLEYRE
jgi:Family of unknown function (DUF5677)